MTPGHTASCTALAVSTTLNLPRERERERTREIEWVSCVVRVEIIMNCVVRVEREHMVENASGDEKHKSV
jgi:hypothetical protein